MQNFTQNTALTVIYLYNFSKKNALICIYYCIYPALANKKLSNSEIKFV